MVEKTENCNKSQRHRETPIEQTTDTQVPTEGILSHKYPAIPGFDGGVEVSAPP